MSGSLATELRFFLERPLYVSAARAAVCSSVRREHLELEISVMWYRIESSECGSSEQCVIATAEGDDIED